MYSLLVEVVVGRNMKLCVSHFKEAGRIFYDFDGFCLRKQGGQGRFHGVQ